VTGRKDGELFYQWKDSQARFGMKFPTPKETNAFATMLETVTASIQSKLTSIYLFV
jgi:hypothetical protein